MIWSGELKGLDGGTLAVSGRKPKTEKKQTQELQKSADIKPEKLFKEKKKEIEEAQLPPPEKPKQTTMASEKHDFKPPKPRTYSGKGKDKDPETFEQWKQEVLDYFDLTSMLPSKHIKVLSALTIGPAAEVPAAPHPAETERHGA